MNRLQTNLTSLQPEQLLERFRISAVELDAIRLFGRALSDNMTEHVAAFLIIPTLCVAYRIV